MNYRGLKQHNIDPLYKMYICFRLRFFIYLFYALSFYLRYETVNIDLSDKPDWYLQKINCLGLVPSIEEDNDVIYDSVIVNEYLDRAYPGEKLLPSDPRQAAKDKMLLEVWSKVITILFYQNELSLIF